MGPPAIARFAHKINKIRDEKKFRLIFGKSGIFGYISVLCRVLIIIAIDDYEAFRRILASLGNLIRNVFGYFFPDLTRYQNSGSKQKSDFFREIRYFWIDFGIILSTLSSSILIAIDDFEAFRRILASLGRLTLKCFVFGYFFLDLATLILNFRTI